MRCSSEYVRGFAIEALGKTWFASTYRPSRKAILLEREMQLLPAAAPKLARYKQLRQADDDVTSARIKVRDAIRVVEEARKILNANQHSRAHMQGITTHTEDPVQLPCPADGCTGFVSSQWKCGTCQQWACRHCREIIGFDRYCEHECNPDTLASIAEMKSLGKPCPGCKTMTERSEGCSQMYCTRCGCWWNFRTGKKDTSSFRHNPHHAALAAAGNEIVHDDDCALGVLTRAQSRQLLVNMTRVCRGLLPGPVGSDRVETVEELVELVGEEHAKNVIALFRLTIIATATTENDIVRSIGINRPFRRLHRLIMMPAHLAETIRRLRDLQEDSSTAVEKATEHRLQHIIGEITTDQLQRRAWKRHNDSNLASAQIDVLQAVHDTMGHALMQIHKTLPSHNALLQFDHGTVRDTILPRLLEHLRGIGHAMLYANNHTNRVKQDYSRSAWGFDVDNAILYQSAALIATVEGST